MFGKPKITQHLQCSIDDETGVMLLNVGKNLDKNDFDFLQKLIDEYFDAKGEFKGIIINSKKFPYWKGALNREEYKNFAAANHHKFAKVALAMDGFFVRLLPQIVRGRVHPEVKNFAYNQIERADEWILQ